MNNYKVKNGDIRLPNLICPGAQKAGTTTLFKLLRQHPEIEAGKKEIKFFNNNYHRGIKWYSGIIDGAVSARYLLDCTPGYMTEEVWVQRMKDTLDDNVKFIIILRNPVDRMYSTYGMYVRIGIENEINARKAFDRDYKEYLAGKTVTNYFRHSLYSEQIEYFTKRFSPKNIKIILFEDMTANPKGTVMELLDYLGLEEVEDMQYDIWANKAGMVQYGRLARFTRKIVNRIPKGIRNRLPSRMANKTRKLLEKRVQSGERAASYQKDMALCHELMDRFEADIRLLENLINKDLGIWIDKYR